MGKNSVWVVIPAYNESRRIEKVIRATRKYAKNIVVVDDGSKDKTSSVAEKSHVAVLRHVINLGKGAAMKTGCDYAMKHKAGRIILIDADGQHDPKEIPRFLRKLNKADIVFGRRRRTGRMPLVLKFGNWFIHNSTKLLFGIDIYDTQCGYRAFNARVYRKIRWRASDYSVESEMIANVGKNSIKYDELQIDTIYSDRYKGTTVLDGIKIIFNMLFWRIRGYNNKNKIS